MFVLWFFFQDEFLCFALSSCRYAGEFNRGKFNGYGIYTRQDDMKYQGQFNDGKPEGYGKIYISS